MIDGREGPYHFEQVFQNISGETWIGALAWDSVLLLGELAHCSASKHSSSMMANHLKKQSHFSVQVTQTEDRHLLKRGQMH